MTCPHAQHRAQTGGNETLVIQQCPFLSSLKQHDALQITRQALRASVPAGHKQPLLEENYNAMYDSMLMQVHGPKGIVPLARFDSSTKMHIRASDAESAAPRTLSPCASISLSFGSGLPDPLDLLHKITRRPRKPRRRPPTNNDRVKPPRSSPNNARSSIRTRATTNPTTPPSGGRCPMRKFIEPLGGLLPLIQQHTQHLKCPSAIVVARAAVAKTAAVRQLRPQPLFYKMAAVGALAALINMPFGVWREHTTKFSPAWFAAVHAPIPFIAIFRKAVIMPKWAMLLTFSAAIAGQAIGAHWERDRVARGGQPWLSSLAVGGNHSQRVLRLACPMTYSQQAERFVDGVCRVESGGERAGAVACPAVPVK